MRFADIPGQTAVKSQLQAGFASGRIPHAQLFAGPEGSGKLPLAWAYAQLLLCHSPSEQDACGQCPACRKVEKLIHPDLHWVFPVVNKGGDSERNTSEYWMKEFRDLFLASPHMEFSDWRDAMEAENRQANIARSECYTVLSKLGLAAFEGRYKVVVMWLAEYLGEAGNLLLKMLEEPPDQTVFLLVSTHPEHILPTILSRTRTIRIPPLEAGAIEGYLQGLDLTPERAANLAMASEGNIHKALQWLNETTYEHSARFMALMRLSYASSAVEVHHWVTECGDLGRESLKGMLDYAMVLLRQCYLYRHLRQEPAGLKPEERDFLIKFSPFISAQSMGVFQTAFETAAYQIERNGHVRLVLHNLFFALQEGIHAERKRQRRASEAAQVLASMSGTTLFGS